MDSKIVSYEHKTSLQPNPEQRANILSRITIFFLTPLICKGRKKTLNEEDLCEPMDHHQSRYATEHLTRSWENEKIRAKEKGVRPSMQRAIVNGYGWRIASYGVVLFFEAITQLLLPLFIEKLIRHFKKGSTSTMQDAYIAAAGVTLMAFLSPTIHHPMFYGLQKMGMELKCAAAGIVMEKSVRLSSSAMRRTTVGQITNILTTDVSKFDFAFLFLHYIWVTPLMFIAYFYIIWQRVGIACVAGFGVVALVLPVQLGFSRLIEKYKRQMAERADARISMMTEILNGIRVIKMYAWEDAFSALIEKLRLREMEAVKRFAMSQAAMLGFFWASGKLIVTTTAIVYVYAGNAISAEIIFVVSALFNACRLPFTLFLPFAVQCYFDLKVSLERIERFLLLDEFSTAITWPTEIVQNGKSDSEKEMLLRVAVDGNEWRDVSTRNSDQPIVQFENYSSIWHCELESNRSPVKSRPGIGCWGKKERTESPQEETEESASGISDISLTARGGQLVAVIGAVGSGKSTLLSSILCETHRVSGRLTVRGTIAFCSQDPWIFPGTLRENITFGLPFNTDRYAKAVEVSALTTDLKLFPAGDETVVGDRGASLSGGQKARIALARAVYCDADIYLLDDPLSAVDASVGRLLFYECIRGILRPKVVILVTHQVQFLDDADVVVVMRDGKLEFSGTPSEVHVHCGEILAQVEQESAASPTRTHSMDLERQLSNFSSEGAESVVEDEQTALLNDVIDVVEPKKVDNSDEGEESGEGTVPWSVYVEYMKRICARPFFATFVIFVCVLSQFLFVLADVWLQKWTDACEKATLRNSSSYFEEDTDIFGFPIRVSSTEFENVLIIITFVLVLITIARCMWFRLLQVNASRLIHRHLFDAIVNTSMRFFDKNPIGRILNRFSKDMNVMDDSISMVSFEFFIGVLNLVSIVFLIVFVNHMVAVPLVPLILLFWLVRYLYLSTSRDLKRLEATTRSPLLSHMSSVLGGLVTIRALGRESSVLTRYHNMQDVNISAFYLTLAASRWFAVLMDWLVITFIAFVSFLAVLSPVVFSSGEVAVMLVYAIQLTGFFSWVMRQSAELQNGMVAMERIANYSALESEHRVKGIRSTSTSSAENQWPDRGHIKMENLWMKYSEESEFVLKGISVDIQPKEKIGIVGRTGSGKSSLLRVLFRLTQPSSGHVYIDDVDTATVPLPVLRRNIAIIPQEPVLFVGTIRRNLDPFDEFSDADLWRVLDAVELRDAVSALRGGLEGSVAEGGVNMSVGQRQLLCLARALLRKKHILVIDEATANVDNKTDALIQRTIRSSFADATVLTIAHRLHTIMDSDRVIVLEAGELREMDHPHVLLQKKSGVLNQLVSETGKQSDALLRTMAKRSYDATR